MKKITIKRIGAYLLDTFLIVLVANLLSSINFINSDYKKYGETYKEYDDRYNYYQDFIKDFNNYYSDEQLEKEEYNNLINDYLEFEVYINDRYDDSKIDNDEYDSIIKDINNSYQVELIRYNYSLSKLNVIPTIILVICLILYFGVTQYLMGGQTLGKRIFNLKVVEKDKESASLGSLLIRTVIVTGVLISIAQIICLFVLNENDYYNASYYIKLISYGIEFMILITILFRTDNCGLHDLIARTKVVDINNVNESCDNSIMEAEYTESDNQNNK